MFNCILAVPLTQVLLQPGLKVGTRMINVKLMFRSKNWVQIVFKNDKSYSLVVLHGTFFTNL
jgi:hypothetical protein